MDGSAWFLVAFMATEQGLDEWRRCGSKWAYEHTEWAEDIDAFPLWQYLYTHVRENTAVRPVNFCGPLAEHELALVFAGAGEALDHRRGLVQGGAVMNVVGDVTPRKGVSPPLVWVQAPTQDRHNGVVQYRQRVGPKSKTHLWRRLSLDELFRQVGWVLAQHRGEARSSDVTSVGDLVDLELVERLGREAAPILEPLLSQVTRALDDGRLDSDPQLRNQVERDRKYLADELYENPDSADSAIVLATSSRLLRVLASLSDEDAVGLLHVVAETAVEPLKATSAVAVADMVADTLGRSADFESGGDNPYEWVATHLGWWQALAASAIEQSAVAARAHAVTGVGVTGSVATILVALGVSGPVSVLIGTYLSLLAITWRPRPQ